MAKQSSSDAMDVKKPKSYAEKVSYEFAQLSWHASDDSDGVHLAMRRKAGGGHVNVFISRRDAKRLTVILGELYPDAEKEH